VVVVRSNDEGLKWSYPIVCVQVKGNVMQLWLFTFRVRRSRGEMYIGHGRLCVCLSVPHRIPTLLHRPGCNFEEW